MLPCDGDLDIMTTVVVVVRVYWVSDPLFERTKALLGLRGFLSRGGGVTKSFEQGREFDREGVRGGGHCDRVDGGGGMMVH